MAPESARIGNGMIKHKRAEIGKLSSDLTSSESSDSNAANGLGWEKREIGVEGIIVDESSLATDECPRRINS